MVVLVFDRRLSMIELGSIRRRRGVSCYHQLYIILGMALERGIIEPGSTLPSEKQLMRQFAVSRNTVRRSLAQLELEKRILRRRGSGTVARRVPTPEYSVDAIAAAIDNPEAAKERTTNRVLQIVSTRTPAFIRQRDPEFGEKCLEVHRCRSFKRQPFMLSISHVPEHLATRLKRRELARQVVLTVLQEMGVNAVYVDQTTTAVVADAVAARRLDIDPRSALLCIHRLTRGHDGRSIEHHTYLYHPDRFHLRAHLDVDHARSASWAKAGTSQLVPAWL
jgi:GntR family transcriptional regulator